MALRRAINSGNWSSPTTWENSNVPNTGDDIEIMTRVTVVFDIPQFNGGSLTLNEFSALLFPTTNSEKFLSFNTITLKEGAMIDLTANPLNDAGFIHINTSNLDLAQTASWFGSLWKSSRRNNFMHGEWGLVVANEVPNGSTTVTLTPLPFYSVKSNLAAYCINKTIYFAKNDEIVTRTITNAIWDGSNLQLTVSSPLPAINAGTKALIFPDPFSSHVFLLADSVPPHFSVAAHSLRINNSPTTSLYAESCLIVDSSVARVTGKGVWFADFRNNPSNKVQQIRSSSLALADISSINYSVFATRLTIEYSPNGATNTIIWADTMKISLPHPVCGQNVNLRTNFLAGYLYLSATNFSISAYQLDLIQLSWEATFDPTNVQISLGNDITPSKIANEPLWSEFLSYLQAYTNSAGKGKIEIKKLGKMHLLRANYETKELIAYHAELRPNKLLLPTTLREEDTVWGLAYTSSFDRGNFERLAWGMILEKDLERVQGSQPVISSIFTGKEITLQPGVPDFEVLESPYDACSISLGQRGRVWFFKETQLTSPFSEPWVWLDGDYLRFHAPATSATMPHLPVKVAAVEETKPIAWRWHAEQPNEYAEIKHFVSEYHPVFHAAIFLRQSQKGWQCKGIIWKFPTIDQNNYPIKETLTLPTLTVLGRENRALGISCYTFIVEDGVLRRISFQDNLLSDWLNDPMPSPIPVVVERTNFTPTNAQLLLGETVPQLVFYDGTQEIILDLTYRFSEYEKIVLKSREEVLRMFAGSLRAKVVLTGTQTTGEWKTNEQMAVTCIVVSGRGRVYFWDWTEGTRSPSNESDVAAARLILEVNSTTPTVAFYAPIFLPRGLYIAATKESTDPYLAVFVYGD